MKKQTLLASILGAIGFSKETTEVKEGFELSEDHLTSLETAVQERNQFKAELATANTSLAEVNATVSTLKQEVSAFNASVESIANTLATAATTVGISFEENATIEEKINALAVAAKAQPNGGVEPPKAGKQADDLGNSSEWSAENSTYNQEAKNR